MVIGECRCDGIPVDHGLQPSWPGPMQPESDLLFVYGTLKRGLANHQQLSAARYAGEAAMPGVDLHDLGPFPMAVSGRGTVLGELYGVDAATLARLDRFEGVPRLYRRERLPLGDGRTAWIYLGQPRQVRHSPRLDGGCWPGVGPLPRASRHSPCRDALQNAPAA